MAEKEDKKEAAEEEKKKEAAEEEEEKKEAAEEENGREWGEETNREIDKEQRREKTKRGRKLDNDIRLLNQTQINTTYFLIQTALNILRSSNTRQEVKFAHTSKPKKLLHITDTITGKIQLHATP